MKSTLQKSLPFIIIALVVAIFIVIVIRKSSSQKNTPVVEQPSAVENTTVQTPSPVSSKVVASPSLGTTPAIGWTVTNISAKDDASSGVKHGTFSVSFIVNAGNTDIYMSPTCQSTQGARVESGVTFSVFKSGVLTTDDTLNKESCAILNHGLSTQLSSGNYVIKAGTENVFELIVADHPVQSGSYQVGISHIGYATADGGPATAFPIDATTLTKLKTQPLAL